MNHEYFMDVALAEAKKGDAPYGAVIVKNSQILAKGCNTVKRDCDPSAHAEMNVIRKMTNEIKSPSLEGYTLYATAEPCPMCATACIWAGIDEIIIGASIQDLIDCNQAQINLACEEIIAKGTKDIKVTKGVLRQESLALFARS
ncbi:nucleoside deaminase [Aliterella atlantica]|uniref:Cytidine deaminase n=1 Tax=Aliterella atlantica CENA595 TaxID=1618023 RepID=A0A0D8ZMQ4_9CYAN|nr:nucleoside deaminase [Aliterella atlantica]KJH70123.1 cytidine deaminase [Aliterella atlantica CENA595]